LLGCSCIQHVTGTGISLVMFKVYIPLVKQGINANAKNYLTILLLQKTYICRIQGILHEGIKQQARCVLI